MSDMWVGWLVLGVGCVVYLYLLMEVVCGYDEDKENY